MKPLGQASIKGGLDTEGGRVGQVLFSSLSRPTKALEYHLELACGRQAFIATWLFDPSMSALPIILKQNSVSVGLFTLLRERELGLDRRETG
jgi:hypothetical protein